MLRVRVLLVLALLILISASPTAAENRFIARSEGGLSVVQSVCALIGCSVKYGLDGTLGQVFLLTTPDLVDPMVFLNTLQGQPGINNAEMDLLLKVQQSSNSVPAGLWDKTPVDYFGVTVRGGYLNQPASQIVRVAEAQRAFNVRGSGVVAVIDTGVDPDHPALKHVLVGGYDFTRDREGLPSEQADLSQSTAALVDGAQPMWVNQSTAALLDQSTAALLDNPSYAAFGHGTMVAGIIHLVAPKAFIMPLKAFRADGSGYTSDVLRAIHRSVQSNAKIINMSFSFPTPSQEISRAITFANSNGVICVASVGNGGRLTVVYPAGFSGKVIGVASTTNDDQRSAFSNYGQGMVWVAAPGEGIISTYPFGTYAAAWGTSFSAPFVSGGAALLVDVQPGCTQSQAAQAIAQAKRVSEELGNGRLDLYQAVQAWRQALGLQ